jgi:hypothetical protein
MKCLTLLLALSFFSLPGSLNAAATYDSKTTCLEGTGATSLNCTFTNTAGNYIVVMIANRLTVGGCGTTDIDALSVTYNGVALSFLKGNTTDGVIGGAGACVFGHLMALDSPATGANTLALSWTGTARVAVTVMSFAGKTGIGTILEDNSNGNFTLSPTITSDDIVMGAASIADATANFACLQSNAQETADGGGNVGSCSNTNTGSGAVQVNGTYSCGGCSALFWALPILGGVTATPQSVGFYTFD